jgi:hypothetical protein
LCSQVVKLLRLRLLDEPDAGTQIA